MWPNCVVCPGLGFYFHPWQLPNIVLTIWLRPGVVEDCHVHDWCNVVGTIWHALRVWLTYQYQVVYVLVSVDERRQLSLLNSSKFLSWLPQWVWKRKESNTTGGRYNKNLCTMVWVLQKLALHSQRECCSFRSWYKPARGVNGLLLWAFQVQAKHTYRSIRDLHHFVDVSFLN